MTSTNLEKFMLTLDNHKEGSAPDAKTPVTVRIPVNACNRLFAISEITRQTMTGVATELLIAAIKDVAEMASPELKEKWPVLKEDTT